MKKIFFWFTLIVGIIAVMGACKSSDDESTTSAKCAGMTVAEVTTCTDTPSGSITGIDNSTMSGVYNPYHVHGISGLYAGVDNTTGCISNSSLLAILGGQPEPLV